TGYIPLLENAGRFLFFVRPRRFGKSLMANMLRCYYDIAEKDNFDALFGGLEIAKNPTANRNRYLVLGMDFSEVNKGMESTLQERFNNYVGSCLTVFLSQYGSLYGADALAEIKKNDSPAVQFNLAVKFAKAKGLPLYLMLDEYDNFTNQMLRAEGNEPYRSVTHGEGFYREWFKSFKSSFDRIYMTGVSPVTMDDLTSGFNIAANISQKPQFNSMLGFSEAECLRIYTDFKGVRKYTEGEPAAWVRSFKPWYDGYCFAKEKVGIESVFNSDMVLYHLSALVESGNAPENMVDRNIKTDYDKLQMIADIQHRIDRARNPDLADDSGEDVLPIIEQLAATKQMAFNLVESFPADQIADARNFRSLFHYYGILSMAGRERGRTVFRIPNACVEKQLFDYLREAYRRRRVPDWTGLDDLAASFAYDGAWKPYLERIAADFADTQPVRGSIDREIRVQGYMQCEFGHLNFYLARPEMELNRGFCDFALFPERTYFGDVEHSYLIELKISPADASDAELAAKYAEAVDQLAKYRADPFVPSLAKGTTLHQIVYQFKGDEMVRLEQIAAEKL
ncbi:MAG: AAA family ATPase, partial [Kiritimatiellae bacterium]|nr:AAA family ATPase [Kiritimatiellia bacterium]